MSAKQCATQHVTAKLAAKLATKTKACSKNKSTQYAICQMQDARCAHRNVTCNTQQTASTGQLVDTKCLLSTPKLARLQVSEQ
jgi:hypothetical protein